MPKTENRYDTCGTFGGETQEGKDCSRTAGWGTANNTGRCKDHLVQSVQQADGLPAPPRYYDGIEIQYWYRVIAVLKDHQLYDEADFGAIESLCENLAKKRESWENIRINGWTGHFKSEEKTDKNPAAVLHNQACTRIKKLSNVLGLTPNARRTLVSPEEEDDDEPDEMEELLG